VVDLGKKPVVAKKRSLELKNTIESADYYPDSRKRRNIDRLIIIFTVSSPWLSCPRILVGHPFLVRLDSRLRGNDSQEVDIFPNWNVYFLL
jgi:hypothetical protein